MNFPLIKHVATFNKPMILSRFSDLKQIERYIRFLPKKVNFSFLQCTAAYPCKSEDLNLKVIKTFREKFKNILIGFSSS